MKRAKRRSNGFRYWPQRSHEARRRNTNCTRACWTPRGDRRSWRMRWISGRFLIGSSGYSSLDTTTARIGSTRTTTISWQRRHGWQASLPSRRAMFRSNTGSFSAARSRRPDTECHWCRGTDRCSNTSCHRSCCGAIPARFSARASVRRCTFSSNMAKRVAFHGASRNRPTRRAMRTTAISIGRSAYRGLVCAAGSQRTTSWPLMRRCWHSR